MKGIVVYRVEGSETAVRVRDVEEAVTRNRRRDRYITASFDSPKLFARFEVVSAGMLEAVDDDLSAIGGRDNERRAPGGHIASSDAPDLFAVREPVGSKKAVRLHVGEDDRMAGVDYRRVTELPLRLRDFEIARVEGAEIFCPNHLAREVEAVESFRTEERDESLAVGCEGRVGVRRLGVTLHLGDAAMELTLPKQFPAALAIAENFPGVLGLVIDRSDVAVKAQA